jgi:hypothetical protein
MQYDPSQMFPESKFKKYPGVPLVDEHEAVNPKTNKSLSIDRRFLQEITDNNNRRVRESGDAVPYVIGHTQDGDDPEALEEVDPKTGKRKFVLKSPPLLGYIANFENKPFKNKKYAIHGDIYVPLNLVKVAEQFPRRSVELWPGKKELDPVCALGATTPERDLGLLIHYDPDNETVIKYERLSPGTETMAVPTEIANGPTSGTPDMDSFMAALMESAPMKAMMAATERLNAIMPDLQELVQVLHEEPENEPNPAGGDINNAAGAGEANPGATDGGAGMDANASSEEEEEPPEETEEPVKKNMGGSMPTSTNGYVPGMNGKKEPVKMNRTQDVPARTVRRDDDEILKLRRETADLRKQQEELKKANLVLQEKEVIRMQRDKAIKAIAELETPADGILFDDDAHRDSEIDLLSKLNPINFEKMVLRMKKNHKRKVPAAAGDGTEDAWDEIMRMGRSHGTVNGAGKHAKSPEDAQQLAAIMLRKGCDLNAALAEWTPSN